MIDDATLIAWIDGQLDPARAAHVEAAVAADPDLAARADQHRRLRQRVRDAFGPMLGSDRGGKGRDRRRKVVRLVAIKGGRDQATAPVTRKRFDWRWGTAFAVTLIAGAVAGAQWAPQRGAIGEAGGVLAAQGPLVGALASGAGLRVTPVFRLPGGALCKRFTGRALTGIACRTSGGWTLPLVARLDAGGEAAVTAALTAQGVAPTR